MNLTSLQERKLNQFKTDIAFLERQIQKQGILHAVRWAWIITMFYYFFQFGFDAIAEMKPLPVFVKEFGWKKLLINFGFAFVYMLFSNWSLKHNLKHKIKELNDYETKLAKETVA